MKAFKYKVDVMKALHDKGVKLGSDCPIGQASLTQMRRGKVVGIGTLLLLCNLLDCSLSDIIDTVDIDDVVVTSDTITKIREESPDRRTKKFYAERK